ncbi:flavin reductase [Microbacterium sp. SYP-A9085]|uniref:flavin reductase n=1 Tax=Microbacterium sp. SYP-A9085 TaxID=2664454 RepID=UPI001C12C606|nr:flavin reductase [Microbacterium sp. SYP-A9085]
MTAEPLYHVVITDDWEQSAMAGEYAAATGGVAHETGGYLRATTAAGLQDLLDDGYRDLELPLTLVTLDAAALRAEGVRVEDVPPHGARVYAPLRRDGGPAVIAAAPLHREHGRWVSPLTAPPAAEHSHILAHPNVLYVGTPAYLVASTNPDGSANLAAASSHFALGTMLCLGIESDGQTALNMADRPGITVNFPSLELWPAVVRLSRLTGRTPVPAAKADRYTYEPDKFGAARLTPQPADLVTAPRVQECRLQFEATVRRMTPGVDGGYFMVEAEVIRVHADPALVREGTDDIEPAAWRPLVYAFRHFFDRGDEVGWLASSRMAPHPPLVD